jgi:hypothetical protein
MQIHVHSKEVTKKREYTTIPRERKFSCQKQVMVCSLAYTVYAAEDKKKWRNFPLLSHITMSNVALALVIRMVDGVVIPFPIQTNPRFGLICPINADFL